jgi:hypothetical protein
MAGRQSWRTVERKTAEVGGEVDEMKEWEVLILLL